MRRASLRGLLDTARVRGEARISFVDDDGSVWGWDAATLGAESERVASSLSLDARPGSLVVIALAEPQDFLPAFWGCQLRGLVPVPLAPPADDGAAFARAWEAWGKPLVVTDADVVERAPSILARAARVGRTLRAADVTQSPLPSHGDEDEHATALVQPSSGTTGRPRGVQLSHRNLVENVRQIGDRLALGATDCVLSWMPLFHDMGLIATHLASLASGAHQMWMTPPAFFRRPADWLRLASAERATILTGTNTSLRLLAHRLDDEDVRALDLGAVRRFLVGAEPISPRVLRDVERRLARAGLREGALGGSYGLAEASVGVALEGATARARVHRCARDRLATVGAAVALANDDDDAADVLEIGRPLDDVDARVVDDDGGTLPAMHVGHVEVRGPNVTRGYLLDDDATRAARRDDGFWRTGDLGFFSPEGALSICGRAKELLFAGGRNLYAEDVEAIACEVDGVRRAVATWATADEVGGVQGLFVVLDAQAEPDVVVRRTREHVVRRTGLGFDAVEPISPRDIPRTTSGKVQRARLGSRLLAALTRASTPATAPARSGPSTPPQWEALVRATWAAVLGRPTDEVPPDVSFASLGGSSVAALEVQGRLEAALGVPLDHDVLLSSPTVTTLAARLSSSVLGTASPTRAERSATRADPDEPIAVVGVACRLPLGDTPDAFWRALVEGKDAIREAPSDRWRAQDALGAPHTRGSWLDDPWAFDAAYFGIDREEARHLDPQQRLFLEVATEALEAAPLGARRRAGTTIGVFAGASSQPYLDATLAPWQRRAAFDRLFAAEAFRALPDEARRALEHAAEEVAGERGAHTAMLAGNLLNLIAGRTAHALGLHGPALVVDTACSSSLVALHLACESLRRGECDLALAGGVALHLTPHVHRAFQAAGALSPTGACRPFSDGADGIVPGEGAAVVVLEPLSRARANGRDVLAVVRGSAVNNDGRSLGIMAPNPEGQRAVLVDAYRRAGVDAARVSLVEAHGTGTLIGDPVEVRALADALGSSRTRVIGSVKANVGHLMAAAGIAGFVKAVLALRHRTLPPAVHAERESPRLALSSRKLRVARAAEPWEEPPPRIAGVSAFGFGGTNCHVVVEEAATNDRTDTPAGALSPSLVLLSAPTREHLDGYLTRLADYADRNGSSAAELANGVAGRTPHRFRAAAVVDDDASIADLLHGRHGGVTTRERRHGDTARVALLFPGQGSQHVGQALGLLERWPSAQARVLELLDGVDARAAFDACWAAPDEAALLRTDVAQPLLFSFQVALAEALRAAGVEVAACLGHSVGELAALACAGVLDVEAALRWVTERGRVMQRALPSGAMAAILAPPDEIAPLLLREARLGIAARNGPAQTVVAGASGPLQALCRELDERGVMTRLLPVTHAFHSPLVDDVLPELAASLPRLSTRDVPIDVVSTVTGALLSAREVDHDYLVTHARRAVRFADALRTLASREIDAFIEVGPGTALTGLSRSLLATGDERPLASLCRAPASGSASSSDDVRVAYEALATLFLAGADIDLGPLEGRRTFRPVPLIPWRHERLRLDEEPLTQEPAMAVSVDGGRAPVPLHRRVWRELVPPSDGRAGAPSTVWLVNEDDELEPLLGRLAQWQRARRAQASPERLRVAARVRPAVASALCAAAGALRVEGDDVRVLVLPRDEPLDFSRVSSALEAVVDKDVRLATSGKLERVVLEAVGASGELPSVDGKAFVILGGTGGVGGVLARALARWGAARVVPVGRGARSVVVDELRALGAEAELLRGDARQPAVITRALDLAIAKGHPLGGVLHAVGAAHLGSLSSRTEEELHDVVSAKVRSAEHLARALEGCRYDFVALISSVTSADAGRARGLVDYAAANAFLEGLAEEQRDAGRPWVALAYPAWRGVGLAASLGAADDALDDEEAVAAFSRGVAAGLSQGLTTLFVGEPRGRSAHYEDRATIEPAPPSDATIAPIPATEPDDLERFLRDAVASATRRSLDDVDAHASLVRLGLDSLAAVDIVKRLEERVGRKLSLTLLLENDTIAKVVSALDGTRPSRAGERAPSDDPESIGEGASLDGAPLLPAQQTFFANHGLLPHLPGYVFVGVELEGPLSPDALEHALAAVWRRHPVLRCAFGWHEGRPAHLVVDVGPPPVRFHDLRALSSGEQDARALAIEHDLRNEPFDLEAPPLCRVVLLQRDERRWSLLLTLHHIAADAWSAHRLLDELLELHARRLAHDDSPLPPLRTRFADAARALGDETDAEESRRFWERSLRDPPAPLALPFDGDPDDEPTGPCELHQVSLPAAELDALQRAARATGVTVFDVVLASYARALREWSGTSDVIVRVANARRELRLPDVERVVGCFADSLPVRLDASADDLMELAQRARRASLDAMRHPFTSSLALAGFGTRSRGGPRGLTPAGLSFPSFRARERWGDLRAVGMRGGSASGFTQLGLIAWESSRGLTLSWSYTQPLFRPATIERLAREHLDVLRAFLRADRPASGPRRRPSLPAGPVLHERVHEVAQQVPERVAVVDGERTVTYAELDERARRVASALASRGVGRGALVGVLARPGVEGVVGVLGALMAGAAYVPADPDYPDERVVRIFRHARVSAVLTTTAERGRLASENLAPVLRLDAEHVAGAPPLAPSRNEPGDLAYVMYTSGTTGAPKGVMVTHDAVARFHDWVHDAFEVDAADRFIQTSALSFGGAVRQMFSPLLAGATIYPVTRELLRDPAALVRFLDDNRITIWNSVPTLWRKLLEAVQDLDQTGDAPSLEALRWILIGGEEVPADLPRRWRARYGEKHRLANLYGSTETVVNATSWEIRDATDERSVPIGRARAGSVTHVLDDDGRPCASGEMGELYVSGPSLALGYLHEPELTAAAFVCLDDGTRAYRTGDLVRARADGGLVYVGRRDTMVKVRGNRVELGEIEGHLREDARVRQACVVEWWHAGHQRLVAFVEPAGGVPVDVDALRRRLSMALPEYMVPHRIEVLDALPLTAAGKIDRRALASRLDAAAASVGPTPTAPEREIEDAVAKAFAAVLGHAEVDADGDFFALGGDSILALDVVRRLRASGVDVPRPMLLYAERTPRALARALSNSTPSQVTVASAPEDLPLLPAQRAFLLAHAIAGGRAPVLGARLPLRGPIDVEVLRRALAALVRRHEALRTSFPFVGGRRRLRVAAHGELPLEVRTEPLARADAVLRRLLREDFDVERGPLVRLALLPAAEPSPALLVAAHHAVVDAVSLGVLARDLGELYTAALEDRPARLTALLSDTNAIVEATRLAAGPASLEWWRDRFSTPVRPLLAAHPLPAGDNHSDDDGAVTVHLSAAASRAFDEAAERSGRSPAAVVLTAFARVLGRWAETRDIVVGVARSGRELPLPDAADLVGCFAAGLPVRLELGAGSFADDLERCAISLREHLAHADVAPDELARALPRDESGLPPGAEAFLSVVDVRRLARPSGGALSLDLERAETTFAAQAAGSRAFLVAKLGREHTLTLHARLEAATRARLVDDMARELHEGTRAPSPPVRETTTTVDAAIVAYLPSPSRLASALGEAAPGEVLRTLARARLFPDARPRLFETTTTVHGRTAVVVLPLFADELERETPSLPEKIAEGVALARRHGARVVSLAGRLPSLTGYGLHVSSAVERTSLDVRVTSGHAATACAVVATTLAALRARGRDLSRSDLGVVGFGSIGQSALALLLEVAGTPRELSVLDLPERHPALERPFAALRRAVPGARLVSPSAAALHDLDVLLCATSGGGIDVSLLRPGAIVVDDSFPPALDVEAAWPRIARGTLFAVDGGRLDIAGEPHVQLEEPAAAGLLARGLGPGMPGCRAEALLLSAYPELPATLGLAELPDVRRWWDALERLGIGAAPLALHGRALPILDSMVTGVST